MEELHGIKMLRLWITCQATAGLLLSLVGDGGQGMDLELKCLHERCCWLALDPK